MHHSDFNKFEQPGFWWDFDHTQDLNKKSPDAGSYFFVPHLYTPRTAAPREPPHRHTRTRTPPTRAHETLNKVGGVKELWVRRCACCGSAVVVEVRAVRRCGVWQFARCAQYGGAMVVKMRAEVHGGNKACALFTHRSHTGTYTLSRTHAYILALNRTHSLSLSLSHTHTHLLEEPTRHVLSG